MRRVARVVVALLSIGSAGACSGHDAEVPAAHQGAGGARAHEPAATAPTPSTSEPGTAAPSTTAPAPTATTGGSHVVRPGTAPAPGTAAPGTGGQTQKGRAPMPCPAGITQVNEHKWTVTRSLAESWMQNPHALAATAREDGEGWQLVGVRTRAAYHLGMRNGDIILEANGHKLNSEPQLLAAYLDLKNDTVFNVTFLREGQKLTYTYQIVD